VFLDEPTSGLDPQSRAHMWDEIRRLQAAGMTIFLTTHYLDEADALCDRISIMDNGEIVAEGTPDELKREISGDVLTLGISPTLADKAREMLADFARRSEVVDGGVRLYVEEGAPIIPSIMRAMDAAGLAVSGIELHRPSLDDVFLAKTGRSLRES
jgi:ABC-2 type transport system ATP-binding protein